MFEKSCEIIYDMIAKRIMTRRDNSNKPNKEVCPPADSNLISAIVHNRRDPKKNPYLIPDGTRGNYKSFNEVPFIEIISSNLSFKSPTELIIGTDSEQEKYAGFLFRQLVLDGLEDINLSKSIEELLDDYIPYAIKHSFIDAASEDGIIFEIITEKYYTDIEDYYIERDYAIARLFRIHKEVFLASLSDMFNKQQNTIKLNKRLFDFMSSIMVPNMRKNRNAYYISISAKEMLSKVQGLWKSTVEEELLLDTVYQWNGHFEDDEDNSSSVIAELITADIDYIDNLARIQIHAEGHPDVNAFINFWTPDLCL